MNNELKIVDIIRPGSINAIIGPVGTLKRILKNQEFFHSRGYDVTVFAYESLSIGAIKEPPLAQKPSSSKKSIVGNIRRKIGSLVRMKAKGNLFLTKWILEKDGKKVEALIDYYLSLNRNPDIIQFHSNYECQLYLERRKKKDAKTVMFLHSDGIPFKMPLQYYPVLEGTSYLAMMKKNLDYVISHVDRIVFIAKIGQENFLKFYPNRTKEDTSVIVNGIDELSTDQKKEFDALRQKSNNDHFKYRLCCTGTINTRKGHRIIIDALHALPKDIIEKIHVDFMGEGGERPVLEDLVRNWGLEKNITFHGLVPNVEIYKYLAKNNIYILMSQNEGLPISIIEAMRAEMPIISTRVSGIPELVKEGYNGFLLNPDCDELVALLKKLPEYDWEEMGRNSRMRFEKDFTFKRMRKEFCDMYDVVLKE